MGLKRVHWQVGLHQEDKEKTTFSTPSGLFQFNVVPFGLCNTPATCERLMYLVLQGLTWKTCLVYFDDVTVIGRTFKDHLKNLREVLTRIHRCLTEAEPEEVFSIPEGSTVSGPSGFCSGC